MFWNEGKMMYLPEILDLFFFHYIWCCSIRKGCDWPVQMCFDAQGSSRSKHLISLSRWEVVTVKEIFNTDDALRAWRINGIALDS